jgi:hypothetical protein
VLLGREVVEVDLVDLVDDLPHQLTRLHVVVRVLENVADDPAAVAGAVDRQFLEHREQFVVDERHQTVAGQPFGIRGPCAPLQRLRNRRLVLPGDELELLVLVIDDLQEEQPAQLGNALRVTVDAGVLAHDVLDGFDRVPDRHGI